MEVCVESVESALQGLSGGCVRLELCSALELGGLTPSPGLVEAVAKLDADLRVLIRPNHLWSFDYSPDELQVMSRDIVHFANINGVQGFVLGCLDSNLNVDVEKNEELMRVAKEIKPKSKFTFHRAFDVLSEPEQAIEIIDELGFDLILTSGQAPSAFEGRELIRGLVQREQALKVEVMPGGGLNENNLEEVLRFTSAKQFHGSAKIMKHTSKKTVIVDEKDMFITSSAKVAAMMDIYNKIVHSKP